MRPTFLPRLVNGPLFDPVVYVRMVNEKKALMFDCGRFRNVAEREILMLDAVCISHAHMNHFMGFDNVLRTILHREAPLRLYGPEGIIDKTLSKLRAYTWNLSAGYGLKIRIHEVCPGEIRIADVGADTGFQAASREVRPRKGARIAAGPRYFLEAAVLDHNGVPCLGYVLKEPRHINIKKGVMEKRGFLAGSWLGRLKEYILSGATDETVRVRTRTGTVLVPVRDLEDLAVVTGAQSIAYLTDFVCTPENMTRIEEIASGADVLFIEAFYLDELRDLARDKGHLTARQAGMIARRLGARRVFPMHVSPRYHEGIDRIYAEMGTPFF